MKVAFICTGNSARSQMAEGFARRLAKEMGLDLEVYSAGSQPASQINPFAIRVMVEKGIDISHQRPKSLEEIPYESIDLVITLCDSARQFCPVLPSAKHIHWDLPDPAGFEGSEEERLEFFRKIRDQIEERLWELLKRLQLRKGKPA
jgi:arsenate reductase